MSLKITRPAWRNTALLIMAVLLSLIIGLAPAPDSDAGYSVSSLNKDNINQIVIQVDNKTDVKLARRDGQWQLIEPFSAPANSSRVNGLLSLLSSKSHVRLPAEEYQLEEFGLAAPHAQIRFDSTEFSFGITHPISNKRYLLHEQDLFLVKDFVYPLISSNPGNLVNPKIIPESNLLTGIELPNFSIHLNNLQSWSINPSPKNLSADTLQTLIDHWQTLQAVYIEYLPNKNIVDDQSVVLHFADSETIRLKIISNSNETALYNFDTGLKYSVDRQTLDLLTSLPTSSTKDGAL